MSKDKPASNPPAQPPPDRFLWVGHPVSNGVQNKAMVALAIKDAGDAVANDGPGERLIESDELIIIDPAAFRQFLTNAELVCAAAEEASRG